MNRRLRLRIRNLRDVHKFRKENIRLNDVFRLSAEHLRRLEKQRFPCPSRLENMDDAEIAKESNVARNWLLAVLNCQDEAMLREQEARVIKLAVRKQLKGQQGEWNEKERLYMALTDDTLSSSAQHLQAAFMVVLHRNLPERLRDVRRLAATYSKRVQRRSDDSAKFLEILEIINERAHSSVVDHFACAIPLSELTDTVNDTALGDDAASCPVCQHPYVAISEFSLQELLDDYPVRIKHCGHVIGKACLERWMLTPKIDEAKYPHRTCPLCRVKVEGVKSPDPPYGLNKHLKNDRRAMEALFELVYGFGMERESSVTAILSCMSDEIACTELLAEVDRRGGGDEPDVSDLEDELNLLQKEKRVWGFRGDGLWAPLRREWMDSGVVRRA